MHRSTASLFDYFVGAGKHGWRLGEAERLRSLEVDHQLQFGGLFNALKRKIGLKTKIGIFWSAITPFA
jgi:hypothetical protein